MLLLVLVLVLLLLLLQRIRWFPSSDYIIFLIVFLLWNFKVLRQSQKVWKQHQPHQRISSISISEHQQHQKHQRIRSISIISASAASMHQQQQQQPISSISTFAATVHQQHRHHRHHHSIIDKHDRDHHHNLNSTLLLGFHAFLSGRQLLFLWAPGRGEPTACLKHFIINHIYQGSLVFI